MKNQFVNVILFLIVGLSIIISIINYSNNRQQDNLIFETINNTKKIVKNQTDIISKIKYIYEDKVDIWTVLNRMGTDYPPLHKCW